MIAGDDLDIEDDDEVMWNCGVCNLLVVDGLHCPTCGGCCPWGCGMDHDEDEDDEPDYLSGYDPDDEFGGALGGMP